MTTPRFFAHPLDRISEYKEPKKKKMDTLEQRQQRASDFLIVFEPGKPVLERLEALERLEWALIRIRPELEKQLGSDFVEVTLKSLFKSFNTYSEKNGKSN